MTENSEDDTIAKSESHDSDDGSTSYGESLSNPIAEFVESVRDKNPSATINVVKDDSKNFAFTVTNPSPLPPASELERLEKIIPGVGQTLLERQEKEQNHRHAMDDKRADLITSQFGAENRSKNYGMAAAFTLMILFLVHDVIIVLKAPEGRTTTLSLYLIAVILAMFVTGKAVEFFRLRTDESEDSDKEE